MRAAMPIIKAIGPVVRIVPISSPPAEAAPEDRAKQHKPEEDEQDRSEEPEEPESPRSVKLIRVVQIRGRSCGSTTRRRRGHRNRRLQRKPVRYARLIGHGADRNRGEQSEKQDGPPLPSRITIHDASSIT